MVNETKSSKRTLIIIIAVAALVTALVVAISVVFMTTGGGDESSQGIQSAQAAEMMPADTLMFMSFNPHLDQAKNYDIIEKTWGEDPLLRLGIAGLADSIKQEGLDYDADIKPWLGDEVSMAINGDISAMMMDSLSMSTDAVFEDIARSLEGDVSGLATAPTPSIMPEMVFAIATKDQAASDAFLGKLRSEIEESEGTALQDTEYKGVKIVHYAPEYEGDYDMAYATVEGMVVLVLGDLEPMKNLIDASQGGSNLTNNKDYQAVLEQLPADQIGYAYVDAGAYMEAVMSAAGPELDMFPTDILDIEGLYGAFQGSGMSVGIESNGVRMDAVSLYDKDALPENFSYMDIATANKAADYVPANTILYFSGAAIGNTREMILDILASDPAMAGADMEEQLESIEMFLGVKFEDLVKMLSGELAIAITYDSAGLGGDPSIPIAMEMLIEANERESFEKMLKSIAELLASFGEMEIPTKTIGDVNAWVIEDPYSGETMAGWGIGKDFFAIASSQGLLEMAFGGEGSKLTDDATYQAAIAPLPTKHSGIMFVNLDQLLDVVYENMSSWDQQEYDRKIRDIVEPVKAISAASEPMTREKGSVMMTMFILIKGE